LAAESPKEAVEEFARPLRRAVSAIIDTYLSGGYRTDQPNVLTFLNTPSGATVRLRSDHVQAAGRGFIEFTFGHNYILTETNTGWVAHTTGYEYALQLENGREIVAYHYDPRGASRVKTPHLHVRGLTAPLPLSRAHFPTGRVAIEEVIRFALMALGVRPRLPEGRWQALLIETERVFTGNRTW
jgi:hypothetical protein